MYRRRIFRRSIKSTMAKWCIFIAMVFGMAGVSFAAHTNILFGDFGFNTGSMSFIFDRYNSQDVVIQLQNGANDIVRELDAEAAYNDKILKINDIGPVDIGDFMQGNAIITIKYAIKTENEDVGIKRPANVESDKDPGYDLGIVEFERMSPTPVWCIENSGGSWGTASGNIGSIPDIVDDYLPDDLGVFHAYNILLPHDEDGVTVGTIMLKQESGPDMPNSDEIRLSSFDLPTQIVDEIKSGSPDSILKIQGVYGFSIPINLDQFNVER